MNYKSQLKGWAVDRVIELHKIVGTSTLDMTSLQKEADELAAYAYVPSEDIDDHAKELFEMIRREPDAVTKIDQLVNTLEYMKEQMTVEELRSKPKLEAVH